MNKIQRAVIDLLTSLYIVDVPFDFAAVLSRHKQIRICSASDLAKRQGLKHAEILRLMGSQDACTFYQRSKGRYLIVYNDFNKVLMTSRRYVFSIAHELGHVFLKHLEGDHFSALSDSEYEFFEIEANKFAGYLLFPFAILRGRGVNTIEDVRAFYNCSIEAAEVVFTILRRWLKNRGWRSVKYIRETGFDEYDKAIAEVFYISKHRRNWKSVEAEYMAEFAKFEDDHFDRMLHDYLERG